MTRRQAMSLEEIRQTDFAKIGRELLSSGKGIPTEYGLLFINEDIPEEQDSETYEALVKIVRSHPIVAWDKMTNKTVLSSMNIIEEGFLTTPDFYDKFIDKNGNLDYLSMNTWLNFEYITSGAFVGSKKYIFPGELMKELVLKTQA